MTIFWIGFAFGAAVVLLFVWLWCRTGAPYKVQNLYLRYRISNARNFEAWSELHHDLYKLEELASVWWKESDKHDGRN